MNEEIKFADWINNNWYESFGHKGLWRLRARDVESFEELPGINVFTSEELYDRWMEQRNN